MPRPSPPANAPVKVLSSGGGRAFKPMWIRCSGCDEFWCHLHRAHVSECACPPIEQWRGASPYAGRVKVDVQIGDVFEAGFMLTPNEAARLQQRIVDLIAEVR